MRSIVTVALLIASILAGCAEPAPEPEVAPTQEPAAFAAVETGPDTGAIGGIVIDQAVRPLDGASVRLLNNGANTTTDADGVFIFEDLEPGTYHVDAWKQGYAHVQAQVVVEANAIAKTQVLLEAIPGTEPYHQTLVHTGFIEVSPGVTGVMLNLVLDTMGYDNPTCDCSMWFSNAGMNTTTFVVEGWWEDSISYPTGATDLYMELFPGLEASQLDDIKACFCTSPIHQHHQLESWREEVRDGDWTLRLSGSDMEVNVSQEYELFVTLFNNGPAPEGWSFLNGDE